MTRYRDHWIALDDRCEKIELSAIVIEDDKRIVLSSGNTQIVLTKQQMRDLIVWLRTWDHI